MIPGSDLALSEPVRAGGCKSGGQRETIPDDIVRAADQIELVDMTPDALRRRTAHGNIYGPDKIDAALANYFRPGNLVVIIRLFENPPTSRQ